MTDPNTHAANKRAVASSLRTVLDCSDAEFDAAIAEAYADDARLFAFHPVNKHHGARAIGDALWAPIRNSFPGIERHDAIVAAGDYEGRDFVCCMARLGGRFEEDWHGIPATRGVVNLRCCEIHQVADDKIVESHVLIDVLDLMRQADCWPVAPSLGAEGQWRNPLTEDGVRIDTVDPESGAEALRIVKAMHAGLGEFDGKDLSSMSHAQYWTRDFMWYGPAGIGTTSGLADFEYSHQIPFLRAFPDRKVATHVTNVADGNYVVTGGWPSVVATHTGPDWLGVGPTGKHIDMRVMDFYRVEGELIAENWVPIDIVNILLQMGVDVFARMRHLRGQPRTDL